MELRHLRYFIAVAETENVSKAALKLHVSQPGLSRQIRDLENELGFELFERSAKSLKLTATGRALLKEAQAVLARLEAGLKTVRSVAVGGRSELHVGYAPSPTARLLPAALRAFQVEFSNVRVRLHDMTTEEMIVGVRAGKLQVALGVRPATAMLRGLQFTALSCEAMRLAVAPNHPLARRREVTLPLIAREPLITYSRSDYPEYHAFLISLFAPLKVRPCIVEEHDGIMSLIAGVEAGGGVALVSRSVSCMAGLRLKLLPLKPVLRPLKIGAIRLASGAAPAAEQFVQCAQKVAAELEE